ncbi:hypothetical protein, partial [Ideonella sp. A 288]|uniref:hypothetical protein n=1 Tax=Ideonella sp. A 288 TaxID=1962181 RepID=UPI0018FEF154
AGQQHVALAVGALVWWRRRHPSPPPGSFDTPSLPGSDWQEIAARYHHSRVEALRGWLGDDQDLVRDTRRHPAAADATKGDDSAAHRRAHCPVLRVDIPLPMRHDRPL